MITPQKDAKGRYWIRFRRHLAGTSQKGCIIMPTHRSYKSPWACQHRRELRKILNGELACSECQHVVARLDGTRPVYPALSQKVHDQLALLAERAGAV